MSQSHAELVRSGYEAFATGDIPAVLAIFADDISWTIPGRSPISRTYTGHDEVLGFFGQLMERSNGTFSLEIHDVLDNGADQVALLVTETARRDDASLTDPGMHLWTVQDGKATTFAPSRATSTQTTSSGPDDRGGLRTTLVQSGSRVSLRRNNRRMKTPVVAELPSRRIRRQRRESRVKRAQAAAVLVSYRRRTATGDARLATALTRWVGR